MAMAIHPEIQRKAQAELAIQVGPRRLPDYEDFDNLVYLQAIVMEAMRWRPIAPFGILHRVTCDDEYNGYFIPKGTNVVPVSILQHERRDLWKLTSR